MWFMHDGYGWGWMAFGAVWMVLFWGGIVALVVWAITRLSGDRERREELSRSEDRPPLEIAKERYARGEITRDQFKQLQDDLR
jgi:putative membrane protein